MSRLRWLAVFVFFLPAVAAAQCLPTPTSFPLTQTAVSSNFAKLYGCFNGGASGFPNPVFTGTATFNGAAIFNSSTTFNSGLTLGLHLPDGWGEQIVLRESHGNSIVLQAHDGALYITTDSQIGFGGTSLAIDAFTKRGVTQQKVLVGPENSGGLGYRMLRVVN